MKATGKTRYYWYHDTPIGKLLLVGSKEALERLDFPQAKAPTTIEEGWIEDKNPFTQVIAQLDEYFTGKRKQFVVPLAPAGTPFQQKVWRALQDIPFGKTASYSEIAGNVGTPNGSRAVGTANARNPIPIIIPCHRVIAKDGSLSGFGGGVETKQFLLDLEQKSA